MTGLILGTAVRGSHEGTADRRRRTWTHRLNRGSVEGAHAVEFSKTVVPLLEGGSFPGVRPGPGSIPEPTAEYSAGSPL